MQAGHGGKQVFGGKRRRRIQDEEGPFTEEQIIGILKHHEAGRNVADLSREHGTSEATIYTWESKYGGLEVTGAALKEPRR